MVKFNIGNKVCWKFGGRTSKFYPKRNELCGIIKDVNPSAAPNSYKVKLDKKSINLLEKLDNAKRKNPIIYPVRDAVRRKIR